MQLYKSTLSSIGLFCFFNLAILIEADKVVVVEFNNGVAPSSTQNCSKADNGKIDNVFNWVSVTRSLRQLQTLGTMSNEPSILSPFDFYKDETGMRELSTYSTKCKNACLGYAVGTCRATGCVGYRRALQHEGIKDHQRDLQDSVCNNAITQLNNGLNDLVSANAISNSCKSFIDAPKRKFTCYDDVIYGQVDSLNIWNVGVASTPILLTSIAVSSLPVSNTNPPFSSGYSFCSSLKVTLTVSANECVNVVSYHLYKLPDVWPYYIHQMNNWFQPYSMYGNTTNGGLNGTLLTAGQYIVDVKPNWLVGKEKRFFFTVSSC
jgi:hypothetical protein